jgi:hypothetical protein
MTAATAKARATRLSSRRMSTASTSPMDAIVAMSSCGVRTHVWTIVKGAVGNYLVMMYSAHSCTRMLIVWAQVRKCSPYLLLYGTVQLSPWLVVKRIGVGIADLAPAACTLRRSRCAADRPAPTARR